MANVLVEEATLKSIANSIRAKNGSTNLYTPREMVGAIDEITVTADDRMKHLLEGTITVLTDDEADKVYTNCFYSNDYITGVEFPNVLEVYDFAFYDCSMLESVNLPSVTRISRRAFHTCNKLSILNINNVDFIGDYTFYGCTKLVSVDLSKITSIGDSTFMSCKLLEKFIIRNTETICTLAASSAFSVTPIASGTGYIYVPDDLVDSYKEATNWSTYADQIKGLSELGE